MKFTLTIFLLVGLSGCATGFDAGAYRTSHGITEKQIQQTQRLKFERSNGGPIYIQTK